jgi:predicted ATPase/DNA-binding XRE family transcriptional regulator
MAGDLAFGAWVRQRRKALDLTQETLAEQAGCSPDMIRKIESGRARPSRDLAELLAARLEVPPNERQAFVQWARTRPPTSPPSAEQQAAPTTPTNLPVQLTTFIDREREIAEVRRLETAHLLTLTGTGGIGKTRLALEAARTLGNRFPDGVWLVELAPLADPDLVADTIAGALGLREEPQRPLLTVLIEYLQSHQLLLILDNCEHLVAAVAHMAETLLRACPGLHILATSREPLGIAGETLFRVPPLPFPAMDQLPPLDQLLQNETVRLFRDRATAVQPAFTIDPTNAAALAQVCYHLDGIPLAVELAATRVTVLTVAEIAARLDDRFRLLTTGSRTGLPRHQTLQALLDWSYDLLPEVERILLRRLAVFVGGWTLEMAETVVAGWRSGNEDSKSNLTGKPTSPSDTLDGLAQLVNKSLVSMEEQAGVARYRMLETVRQYALNKLQAAGEAEQARQRHLSYFLELAEAAEPHLTGPQQVEWLVRLEREHDNLRAALGGALAAEETEAALRLAGALWRFWSAHGHLSAGRRWLDAALAQPDGRFTEARGKALRGAAPLALVQADYPRATVLLEESLALSRASGDQMGTAQALNTLGAVAYAQNEYEHATTLLEESLTLRRAAGDRHGVGVTLNNLGDVALHQHNYARATLLLEESLMLFRTLGDQLGESIVLLNLGRTALERGNPTEAEPLFVESLVLKRALDDKEGIAWTLEGLAGVAGGAGHGLRAARLLGAAAGLREVVGAPVPTADRAAQERLLAVARAQLDDPTWQVALASGQRMPLDEVIEYALSRRDED